LPVVMQAPIGPATTTDLVVAVVEAGGLGCLAASWTFPSVLRAQVREIQRSIDRPFCVNLGLAFDQQERIDLLGEERVPVISFSWGIDDFAIKRARAAGARVLVQVGDVETGERAAAAGADILIAQGVEAGGHVQSEAPLHRLVHNLREAVSLPILAAGGIAESASVVAALDAGAAGVVAGTAYLAADEADVHPLHRDQLFSARASATTLTTLFDVGWPDAPHRVLRNTTMKAWRAVGSPPPGQRPGEDQPVATRSRRTIVRYSDAQPTSDTSGDIEAMALYAGTGVEHVQRQEAAGAITARLLTAASARNP
jgi:NAD(P)H-dependent flavin oxidoreductase YrpB (nitropropane dioxygenase family)